MIIPNNNQWFQNNQSDTLGSLVGTFNVDLTTKIPNIRVTRMLQTTSQTGSNGSPVSTLSGVPVGFKWFNDGGAPKIYTVAGSRVHASVSGVPLSTFSVDATSGTPTNCSVDYSDIEVFNSNLYVTGASSLYKKTAGGSWSTNGTGLTSGSPHLLTTYGNRLYITVSNYIYSMDTSDVITTTGANSLLTIPFNYRITFIRSSSNRIWIGTINIDGGKGLIYEWDGSATQPTRSYKLDSQGALSCTIKDDIPWIVDTNGKLLVYNSGTFTEVSRLPIENEFLKSATNSGISQRFIHPNGMAVIDGNIHLLINNELINNLSSIPEFCPSGVWEYTRNTGLYHKYSISTTPLYGSAIADYGQNRLSAVGGLSDMKFVTTSTNATGTFIAGATVFVNSSTTDVGIFTNDTNPYLTGINQATQKFGYIVTTKIFSPNLTDIWQRIIPRYKKFLLSTDSIIVKYRTDDPISTDIDITWVNSTTFTTTTNLVGLEGYEVEITQATGSGLCAHISTIDVSGLLYTIHLDQSFPISVVTGKARVQNWKKLKTIQDQTSQFNDVSINQSSVWIQFKICMTFTHPKSEVNQFILINKVNQSIT